MPANSKTRYRAWDLKNKKMRRVLSVSFETQKIVFKDDPDNNVDLRDIKLMRYLGIASERRQPICEGDIITFKQDKEIEVALVIYTEKKEWFYYVPRTKKNVIPWNMIDRPSIKEIEIVGNKYENPDNLSKEYSDTLKLWHMYDILSSEKICEDEYCRHDLRTTMTRLSTRTKKELLDVIDKLSSDLRHYKKSYLEEYLANQMKNRGRNG